MIEIIYISKQTIKMTSLSQSRYIFEKSKKSTSGTFQKIKMHEPKNRLKILVLRKWVTINKDLTIIMFIHTDSFEVQFTLLLYMYICFWC